ncbi:DUF222 domain-containing protein [Kribbella sp. NBC_00382]|uniref:HNH endonuclease signature motif containing protein n=1 Tax=Kribbella sp. NBC_00382 TaxID=2975967 RepID=UPI002E1D154B
MFDDGWGDFDAAATLDAAVEFDTEENRAALGKLQATLHFADLHTTLPTTSEKSSGARGGERLVVYGGDGCPAIAEFAPAELGVLLKISSGAAASYIGEALALRHRFPRIWAKTLNGQTVVWRARAVARACLKLSLEAAALVDERVVAVIDTLSAYRLQKIIDAVIKEADPDAARQAAEQHARERGVWVQPSDDHGTKTIWVKASSGDVIAIDASLNDVAWALHELGDPDSLSERRAKAIGWLADPLAAYELLTAARYLATHPTRTDTPTTEADPNEPGAPANPPGAPTSTTPAAPPREPSDTEPKLPKATASRPAYDTSDAGPNPPGAPTGQLPGSSTDAELVSAAAPAAKSADHSSEVGMDLPGAVAESVASVSVGELELPEFPAEEPPGDLGDTGDFSNFSDIDDLGGVGEFGGPGPADEAVWRASYLSSGQEPVGRVHSPAIDTRAAIDPYSRHQLASKLATIKNAAHSPGTRSGRGERVVLYVHITDETLLTGEGIVRVEEHGAFIATQLKELLGHNQVILKPVIDLNEHIDVNAYEIPTRIRERIRLAQPVERFPYSTTETTPHTDLDHIQPYNPHGPPGQTSTTNLTPATRYHHRVKTHAHGWRVQPTDEGALHWTTPNGFTFRVDHTGTHRLT